MRAKTPVRVVVLLAAAVGINYIDRGNLATAAPLIQDELHLSATQLGFLLSAFFWTYVTAMVPAGWLAERYGARRVLAVGVAIWSVATLLTGLANSLIMLLLLRLLLGLGESTAFPSASKALASEVPQSQLGMANGVLSFGYLVGPAIGTFLGGIFCILIEVLVLPGLAIFGLGGGAMVLASLVLATQTFILPRTESQMIELRHSLSIVATATLVVIGASIALRRYLPNAPIFRKLLLNPTPEDELVDLDFRESLVDFSHLVGQQGTATTNLMPSGKAEFDGRLVDVISDGLAIDRGQTVIVTKARGNRVMVRAV